MPKVPESIRSLNLQVLSEVRCPLMINLVGRLRERGNADILDGYEDKTERGSFDLEVADEIDHLRGNLSLAEEGLANALQDLERQSSLIELQHTAQTSLHAENVRLRVEAERLNRKCTALAYLHYRFACHADDPIVVARICHALTDNCVRFTDPERVPCTPENCVAIRAAVSRSAASSTG